jgi:acetyltransferase
MVVGASTDPTKLGGAMADSLRAYGGHLALVNPRGGGDLHATIAEAVAVAPVPVDLAVLCVPAAACAEAVAQCGAVGVRAALICAGGFAEIGGEGVRHQERLLAAARSASVRLLGPNTSGFFAPSAQLLASFVPGVATLRPGPVGLVAASGGLNHALAFALQREHAGLSLGVGIGAGIDVAAPEVLDYLAHDDSTTVVALHLESVTDGDALLAAVRGVSRRKPVVVMVVGKHDIGEFAQSHTGALATSWRTTRALLRQAGAVLADDVDEFVVATSVLARARAQPDRRLGAALVTGQAGPGLVVADALHEGGVALPELAAPTRRRLTDLLPPMTYQANPVDTGRPGPHHADVVAAVAEDPQIGVVGVYGLTEPVVDLVTAVAPARRAGVPIVVGLDGPGTDVEAGRLRASESGVALVVGPRALGVALRAVAEDAFLAAVTADDQPAVSTGRRSTPVLSPLSESGAKELLDQLGVPTPARRLCASQADARRALDELGAPVAAKVSDPDVLHKSDIGGVRLGITNHADMDDAFAALAMLGTGEVLVERMAASGVDLIVSARRDPVFGPVVLVGLGGTATEVYADVAIASVPASRSWLTALPDQLVARALLDGHRGGAVVDREALADVLVALGQLLLDRPEIDEIEVNPLRATPTGLVALDAVVIAGVVTDGRTENSR